MGTTSGTALMDASRFRLSLCLTYLNICILIVAKLPGPRASASHHRASHLVRPAGLRTDQGCHLLVILDSHPHTHFLLPRHFQVFAKTLILVAGATHETNFCHPWVLTGHNQTRCAQLLVLVRGLCQMRVAGKTNCMTYSSPS